MRSGVVPRQEGPLGSRDHGGRWRWVSSPRKTCSTFQLLSRLKTFLCQTSVRLMPRPLPGSPPPPDPPVNSALPGTSRTSRLQPWLLQPSRPFKLPVLSCPISARSAPRTHGPVKPPSRAPSTPTKCLEFSPRASPTLLLPHSPLQTCFFLFFVFLRSY